MNRDEIIKECANSTQEIISWVTSQDEAKFEKGPGNKWTTAQVLDHLDQSDKLMQKALSMPRVLLRYKFGIPNRPVRNYNEVVTRYREKLSQIPEGTASPTPGKNFPKELKADRLKSFSHTSTKLIASIMRWNNNQLDEYVLPHPLMGKMIVREILMWCIYHHYHHLTILKNKY